MAIIKDITEIKFLPYPEGRANGFVNIEGQKFNKLTAIGLIGRHKRKWPIWVFKCECGNYVSVKKCDVVRGNTKSCGCHKIISSTERATKHGKAVSGKVTKGYQTWKGIKQRCLNPKYKNFNLYGGKGINIDEEWVNDFSAFIQYIGEPPTSSHTIDRIDGTKGYVKGNVRWATYVEQGRNTNRNKKLTLDGVVLCMAEWAEKLNISYSTIRSRKRYGWCDKCALTVTVSSPNTNAHICTH